MADRCAIIVQRVFHQEGFDPSGLELLVGAYASVGRFTVTFPDIRTSLGVAKAMGFDLMLNFRMPYFSQTCLTLAPLAYFPLHLVQGVPTFSGGIGFPRAVWPSTS